MHGFGKHNGDPCPRETHLRPDFYTAIEFRQEHVTTWGPEGGHSELNCQETAANNLTMQPGQRILEGAREYGGVGRNPMSSSKRILQVN